MTLGGYTLFVLFFCESVFIGGLILRFPCLHRSFDFELEDGLDTIMEIGYYTITPLRCDGREQNGPFGYPEEPISERLLKETRHTYPSIFLMYVQTTLYPSL